MPLVLLSVEVAHFLTSVPLRGQYLVEPLVVVHLLLSTALVNADELARAERGGVPGGA